MTEIAELLIKQNTEALAAQLMLQSHETEVIKVDRMQRI